MSQAMPPRWAPCRGHLAKPHFPNFPDFGARKRKVRIFCFRMSTSDFPARSVNSQIPLFEPKFEEVTKPISSVAISDLRARSGKFDFWVLDSENGELGKTLEARKVLISYLKMALQGCARVILSGYFPFSQLLQISARKRKSSKNAIYADDMRPAG